MLLQFCCRLYLRVQSLQWLLFLLLFSFCCRSSLRAFPVVLLVLRPDLVGALSHRFGCSSAGMRSVRSSDGYNHFLSTPLLFYRRSGCSHAPSFRLLQFSDRYCHFVTGPAYILCSFWLLWLLPTRIYTPIAVQLQVGPTGLIVPVALQV